MKRVMNVKVFSNKRYGFIWAGLGFVLVVWIGIIDYWTRPVFSSLVFYLVPAIFIIRYVGRPAGTLISIAGAPTWVLTELVSVPSYPHIINPVWNLAEKLSIYFLIVKAIVNANGGRIWVNSIYGKGSTFAFTLPKYPGEINSNN